MLNRMASFTPAMALVFLAGASPVSALMCGEKSPLFTELGDVYFDTDVLPPEHSTGPEFTPVQLFDALATYSMKSGKGEHSVCAGKDAAPHTTAVTIEEIEVKIQGNEVYIDVLEVHPLDIENHHVRIALSVESRHVTVVNDNELVEVIRQRRTSSTGSRFEETRLALSRVDNGIAIQRLLYVNGKLAEWLGWTLSP